MLKKIQINFGEDLEKRELSKTVIENVICQSHHGKCFTDYAKAFDFLYGSQKLWKILKEMGISDHLICLLKNLYAGQEATVRTGHGAGLVPNWERSTSRLLIYCHPAYLTYMQSTSGKMSGWMKHKLESRVPGKIP